MARADTVEAAVEESTPGPWIRRGLPVVLLIAFLLRLGFVVVGGGDDDGYLLSDAREYVTLGGDFVDAYGDDDDPFFIVSLERTPIYPLWLAAIFAVSGESLDAASLAQVIVGVVTVLAVYVLTRRLFGPLAALAAAALAAIDFTSVVWGSYLQPEGLFTLIVLALVLAWHRGVNEGPRWLLVVAGALLGAAVLTRPVAVFLPLLFAPLTWFALPGDRVRRGAWTVAFAVVAVVPIAAWVARNEAATGVPFLSTVEGRNLLMYRAADAVAEDDGTPIEFVRTDLVDELERRVERDANPGERSREQTSLGLEVLRDHPVGAAISAARGVGRLLMGPGEAPIARRIDRGDADEADTLIERGVVGVSFLTLLAIYTPAAIGVYVLVRRREWLLLTLLVGLAAYFVIVPAGPEAYGRFRVPVMPFLAILGGVGIAAVIRADDEDEADHRDLSEVD